MLKHGPSEMTPSRNKFLNHPPHYLPTYYIPTSICLSAYLKVVRTRYLETFLFTNNPVKAKQDRASPPPPSPPRTRERGHARTPAAVSRFSK